MVFGFFSRKQPHPADSTQLRTPSPSIQLDESPPQPSDLSPSPEVVTDSSDLYQLIRSVPAPTLWTYTLTRLRPTNGFAAPTASTSSAIPEDPLSPQILTALTTFFSSLTPPPTLHCIRCHKSYTDVDNNDRSCRVPHDDDSAEVDGYETLYNCCGKTVEGTGDMGPPDGWCYEGMHTTDSKRARFRADSTPYDDKLASCIILGCHGPLTSSPRSTRSTKSRKARPSSPFKASNYLSSPQSIATARKGKRRRTEDDDNDEPTEERPASSDIKGKGKEAEVIPTEEEAEEESNRGRSRGRKRPRKSDPSIAQDEPDGVSSTQAEIPAPEGDKGPASRTRSRSRSRGPTKPLSSLAIIAAAKAKAASTSNLALSHSTSTPSSRSNHSTKPASKSSGKPASKATSLKPASKVSNHRRGTSVASLADSTSSSPAQTPTLVGTTAASSSPLQRSATLKDAVITKSSLHTRGSSMVVEIPVSRTTSVTPSRVPSSNDVIKTRSWKASASQDCVVAGASAKKKGLVNGKHLGEVVASSIEGEEFVVNSDLDN